MRRRTLPLELLLLAFFVVFLLYPLAYVIPGSATDEEYQVRLTSFGQGAEHKAQVLLVLAKSDSATTLTGSFALPRTVKNFPIARQTDAGQLADQLRQAGGQAEVVRQRNWTGFYFQQALGFQLERSEGLPFFRLVPNAPSLWECLRNSLALGFLTTLATTLLCLPLAYWFSPYRFPGRGLLSALLLVPLIVPPFVGAIGLERFLNRFRPVNLWLLKLGVLQDESSPPDWLAGGGFLGVVNARSEEHTSELQSHLNLVCRLLLEKKKS